MFLQTNCEAAAVIAQLAYGKHWEPGTKEVDYCKNEPHKTIRHGSQYICETVWGQPNLEQYAGPKCICDDCYCLDHNHDCQTWFPKTCLVTGCETHGEQAKSGPCNGTAQFYKHCTNAVIGEQYGEHCPTKPGPYPRSGQSSRDRFRDMDDSEDDDY